MDDILIIALIGGGVIILFSVFMLTVCAYFHLKQKRKDEPEDVIPPHQKQKNFDRFIKSMIATGMLRDIDDNYKELKSRLYAQMELELREYVERREAEENMEVIPQIQVR
jgi:replicative superfamily II helicase